MPDKSLPWLILEAYVTRLQAISTDDGYWTDAGHAIYLGRAPELDAEDDPPVAIAVVALSEEIIHQKANVFTNLPVEVQGVAQASLDNPYAALYALLSDIKRAVELEDRKLGGLLRDYMERGTTRQLEREPGSTTVGLGIAYANPYLEGWGGS